MPLLAVDTAGPICSACVFDEQTLNVISERAEIIGRGHAEHLPLIVEDVLEQADIEFRQITKLAVTVGPGSFAGIRVGISFVRALKLALNVPAVGVSSLQALAWEARNVRQDKPILAILDAKRDQFYIYGIQQHGQEIIVPTAIEVSKIGEILSQQDWLLCGDGAKKALDLTASDPVEFDIIHQNTSPSIEFVAKIAGQDTQTDSLPTPLYLREADAKVQTNFALDRQ